MKQSAKIANTSVDTTTFGEMPKLAAKGFFMGMADIVPGVSGGTIALILGIYVRLIDAVRSIGGPAVRAGLRLHFLEMAAIVHWKFLSALLAGIMAALLFFTRVVRLPELMTSHPEAVYGLFFGLIVGSIWFVLRDSRIARSLSCLWILIGIMIGLRVVTLVPADTPTHPLFIFLSGAIAVTAMILPGISGSFILLIMRQYQYIVAQLGRLGGAETGDALVVLFPFVLGLISGIVVFSRVLSWFLHRWRTPTYLVLAGFMIGSLWIIWPWQERVFQHGKMVSSSPVLPEIGTTAFWWGAAMMVIGTIAVGLLEMSGRHESMSPATDRQKTTNAI